uniref:Uncharacterized protein n=1 Tax=Plectus sambesii TaxID=2011161 RepID=A0A914W5M5_9BILA
MQHKSTLISITIHLFGINVNSVLMEQLFFHSSILFEYVSPQFATILSTIVDCNRERHSAWKRSLQHLINRKIVEKGTVDDLEQFDHQIANLKQQKLLYEKKLQMTRHAGIARPCIALRR